MRKPYLKETCQKKQTICRTKGEIIERNGCERVFPGAPQNETEPVHCFREGFKKIFSSDHSIWVWITIYCNFALGSREKPGFYGMSLPEIEGNAP